MTGSSESAETEVPRPPGRARTLAGLAAGLCGYLTLHALSFGRIPAGLEGGASVEALRGARLVLKRKLEVMTFSIGPSSETLYLYVVGAFVEALGPRWGSVVLPSVLCATLCVALTVLLVRALAPSIPGFIPFLLSVGSVWLFHYGQVGLRAISAPLFLLAIVLLVHRSETRPSPGAFLACGSALGLALYAYTACRVFAIAWVVWRVWAWWKRPGDRGALLRGTAWTFLGAVSVSIPNLLFFLREPGEFLGRGYYVYRGGVLRYLQNLLWTFLFPFHYPSIYHAWLGPGHNFDMTGVSLTASGVAPLDLVTALAFGAGLAVAWTRRTEPGVSYLLVVYVTGSLLLGISGPSLTRLLTILPVYLVFAALALGALWAARPRLRPLLAATLLFPAASGVWGYVARFGASERAQAAYHPASNAVSARARDLADGGARVLMAIRRGRDFAKFYNYRHIERIFLVEAISGPFELTGDPVSLFRPDAVVVERAREFAAFSASLGRPSLSPADALYDEYRLSWEGALPVRPEPGNIRKLWVEIER